MVAASSTSSSPASWTEAIVLYEDNSRDPMEILNPAASEDKDSEEPTMTLILTTSELVTFISNLILERMSKTWEEAFGQDRPIWGQNSANWVSASLAACVVAPKEWTTHPRKNFGE